MGLTRMFYTSPLWRIEPPLSPFQLLSMAPPSPDDTRAWLATRGFFPGLVPLFGALLTLHLAWRRRAELVARRAVWLMGASFAAILVTRLVPSPATALMIAAAGLLVVALGALPSLDRRFGSPTAQFAMVAVALLAIFPGLRPA